MTAYLYASTNTRLALWIVALAVSSALLTLGFACAAPIAAFATIAAIAFSRRDALIATAAMWFANQAVGFVILGYPMDSVTLAWGGALGAIALLSCETAGFTTRRIVGFFGGCAAFLAAFLAYEGSLIVIDIVAQQSGEDFALATVWRIFLVNASAFGGLWSLWTLASTTTVGRKLLAGFAPRHA